LKWKHFGAASGVAVRTDIQVYCMGIARVLKY
jgi:hypothetical protein